MFEFPQVAIFIVSLVMTVSYFLLMVPKFNLSLWVFLGVTLSFSAVQVMLGVSYPSAWSLYGGIQCALYDVGVVVHLILGKRKIRDVVGYK